MRADGHAAGARNVERIVNDCIPQQCGYIVERNPRCFVDTGEPDTVTNEQRASRTRDVVEIAVAVAELAKRATDETKSSHGHTSRRDRVIAVSP